MMTCTRCDQRMLVAWAWRCSEHHQADRWICGRCAIRHQDEGNRCYATSCLWWRPVRTVGGSWYQQAVMDTPHRSYDDPWD